MCLHSKAYKYCMITYADINLEPINFPFNQFTNNSLIFFNSRDLF